MVLLGNAKLLAPPKRGPAPQVDAPFEHKAGIVLCHPETMKEQSPRDQKNRAVKHRSG